MKKQLLLTMSLLLLGVGGGNQALAAGTSDDDYNTGDTYTYGGRNYTISGSNLFSNGGFEDGVTGWKANFYSQDATLSNFTYANSGGYNDGAYITVTSGAGAESVYTPCQAIQVETGAMYLFVGYTKGTKPDDNNLRYNGLFEMSSTTTEVLQSGSGHDAVVVAQLKWGDGTEWTKTEQVFIASTDYVGARFTWCNGASFDGMQLYKIEDTSSETLSSDNEYKEGDTYVDGNTTYTVKSGNLVTNGGFEDSSLSGWVGSSYTSTTTVTGATHHTTGGFNNGTYVTLSSSGATDGSTPHQAISVGDGKMYLFIGYTSGTTVTAANKAYNCLFKLNSSYNEDGYWTQLNWGVEAGVMTTSWTKTEYVFTAESNHPYVGIRLGWSGANYDGFQLYEIEEAVVEADDDEYHEDDEYSDGAFKVLSDNLFVNGGFNSGVEGWTAGGYTTAAVESNFTIHTTGGYNGGAYLTSTLSGGASSEHTISQAIQVEKGAYYLFIGYTSGIVPQARYSALFEMNDDGTAELNHEESDGQSYSNEIVRLTWGDDGATEWTKTESVFLATTSYVGMRMGWTTGSYDGFQLYKLEVVVPEDASPENPVDLTSLIINPNAYLNSSEGWTCSNEGSTLTRKSGEHWSGTSTSYFDSNSWDGYLWEEEMTQDITLPYAGVYKLTAAGRSSLNARTVLYAGDMEYTFPAIGATGGTIAIDGTEWESVEAGLEAGKNFANSDQGYGWNWGSVEVVAASAGKLTIGARFEGYESETRQWASIVNFKLAYLGSDIDAVKDALAADIADAKEIDITTNVGTTPFLRPQELADALTAAIEAAETALADNDATEESLTAALTALQTAIHDFDNAELNAPAEGETFSIVLVQERLNSNSSSCNGTAVQSDTGNESAGGYAFHFTNTPNRNFAPQNYKFTPNSSKQNGYTISFADENSATHYICLGTVYSGGTNLQIRATESEESAFVFQVVPGSTEGIWHIYNSDNGKNVGNGANDGGLYTGNSGSDSLQIVSNAIPVNITEAGWTTLVLPYDAELPSTDLKAYTIAGQSTSQENAVTLTEVEDVELKAKIPYLISGTDVKEYAINGTSTIFDLSTEAKDDYLVGTWEDISSVTAGNYVLQYQSDKSGTAFYIVNSGDSISLAANRCYLLGSSVSTANAPYFSLSMGDNVATAIESALEAAQSEGNEAIYDLSGRKVSKAQKGIYIKGGKKVIIK